LFAGRRRLARICSEKKGTYPTGKRGSRPRQGRYGTDPLLKGKKRRGEGGVFVGKRMTPVLLIRRRRAVELPWVVWGRKGGGTLSVKERRAPFSGQSQRAVAGAAASRPEGGKRRRKRNGNRSRAADRDPRREGPRNAGGSVVEMGQGKKKKKKRRDSTSHAKSAVAGRRKKAGGPGRMEAVEGEKGGEGGEWKR